jgi:Protein of unknown function (DUF3592)
LRYYFAVIGIILIIGAAWLFVRRIVIYINGLATEGWIESYEKRESDDTVYYLPIVSFVDYEGKQRRFTSVAGGSSQNQEIGTKVLVRYQRTNPDAAYISSFLHMWAAPLALLTLGVCGLLAYSNILF